MKLERREEIASINMNTVQIMDLKAMVENITFGLERKIDYLLLRINVLEERIAKNG